MNKKIANLLVIISLQTKVGQTFIGIYYFSKIQESIDFFYRMCLGH